MNLFYLNELNLFKLTFDTYLLRSTKFKNVWPCQENIKVHIKK